MALTSDFLQGNILDQLDALRRRVEELEKAQKTVAAALGITERDNAGGKGDGGSNAAGRGGAATRLFLQDMGTGDWWQVLAANDGSVEYIDLLRVRENEVV